jgi:hypothetical protein
LNIIKLIYSSSPSFPFPFPEGKGRKEGKEGGDGDKMPLLILKKKLTHFKKVFFCDKTYKEKNIIKGINKKKN